MVLLSIPSHHLGSWINVEKIPCFKVRWVSIKNSSFGGYFSINSLIMKYHFKPKFFIFHSFFPVRVFKVLKIARRPDFHYHQNDDLYMFMTKTKTDTHTHSHSFLHLLMHLITITITAFADLHQISSRHLKIVKT